MNHIYSVLWNRALGRFCVTSEIGRSRSRAITRRHAGTGMGLSVRLPALALSVAMAWAMPAWSQAVLPQGAKVVSGNAQITTSGNQMLVQQGSAKAILDWQSFNIGKGQQVQFQQPDAASVALNRVVGADASAIHGTLKANGQVFLVNPNGVLFGKGANVNVGSLVASTLDISNENFLKGNYQFNGKGAGLQGASVINQGTITATDGGAVALLGGSVTNQGTIAARLGSVALAAGNQVSLDFAGDGLLNVQVSESAVNALAENQQLLQADGGSVLIAAKATDALLQTVVNNTGTVLARTVENRAGKIVLLGGFNGGTARVAGALDASAPEGGNGGFIETSGAHVKIADSADITTLAPFGRSGTWLIDPNDFTIAANGGDITGREVEESVAKNGTVTFATATMGTPGGNGDIHVNDNMTWTANTLELNAERNINVNAVISVSGSGKLALNYGDTKGIAATAPAANSHLKVGGRVDFAQVGTGWLSVNGHDYKLINSLNALQDMRNDGGGKFALGGPIDATETVRWNDNLGFAPIVSFTGLFDGLGHTITGLTINRPNEDYVGLFGSARNATLRNVGLVGGSVTGRYYTGGLVGLNDHRGTTTSILNVYATVNVTGETYVGGLIGENNGVIASAYATGVVTGEAFAISGGLVGGNSGSISNAYATGDVSGGQLIGGLIGNNRGSISNAYATGQVSGVAATYIAGLVGVNFGIIENAYATGNVSGNGSRMGGLTGHNSGSISNAYATGNVSSYGGYHTGGLAGGNSGSISNAYATGNVAGEGEGDAVGGLVGNNEGEISKTYASGEVSGGSASYVGGAGR